MLGAIPPIWLGQYTPPGLGTRIAYPGFDGVMDWCGASIDPARRVLIANTSYIPFIAEGIKEKRALQNGLMQPWGGWESNQPYPKPKEFAVGRSTVLPMPRLSAPGCRRSAHPVVRPLGASWWR